MLYSSNSFSKVARRECRTDHINPCFILLLLALWAMRLQASDGTARSVTRSDQRSSHSYPNDTSAVFRMDDAVLFHEASAVHVLPVPARPDRPVGFHQGETIDLLPNLTTSRDGFLLRIQQSPGMAPYLGSARLNVFMHPDSVDVVLDSQDRPHSIWNPATPHMVRTSERVLDSELFQCVDGQAYTFSQPDATDPAFSMVFLEFPKNGSASEGRLVLHAKTTEWLEQAWSEYCSFFGVFYSEFESRHHRSSAGKCARWWKKQGASLKVEIWNGKKWSEAGCVDPIHGSGKAEVVIPIDLEGSTSDVVLFRITSALNFWSVDYAALDCTREVEPVTIVCPLNYAVDQHGQDVGAALRANDGRYSGPLTAESWIVLSFGSPECVQGMAFSGLLQLKYNGTAVDGFMGIPDFSQLRRLSRKNSLAEVGYAMMVEKQSDQVTQNLGKDEKEQSMPQDQVQR